MAKPDRAEETAEDHDRHTHGYLQERDLNRNGISDAVEEEEKENAAKTARAKRDLNNNGIPDHLESNPANDVGVPFDGKIHRNSTLDRETRDIASHIAATQFTDEASPDYKDGVKNAVAKTADLIQQDEAKHKKGNFGKGDLKGRMQDLRKRMGKRASVLTDLSRLPAAKADPDSGMDVVKASWKGFMLAMINFKQEAKARQDAKLQEEMEDIRAAQAAERKLNEASDVGKDEGKSAAVVDNSPETPLDKAKDGSGPEGGQDGGQSGPINGQNALGTAANDHSAPSDQAASDQKKNLASDRAVSLPGKGEIKLTPHAAINSPISSLNVKWKDHPLAQGQTNRQKTLSAVPNRTHQSGHSPVARPNGLLAQAKGLPRTGEISTTIGPQNPPPRTRVIGLGTGLGAIITAARSAQHEDPSIAIQRFSLNQRDKGGMGR